ncbi:glycosyltransferase [Roseibium sediminicola]|uniref:Glycosyltransferase n=1 Tax=Roseibium sediminicola TaxID=2933272 RepID=A0ABT0H1J0_9HYPH|nr:glycosyltransferase family 2 protein [Roseibium sp. CAU 1639]MCK7615562.1 glycosyltransferase [Roseibium sp. CAU 1639]
MRSSLPRTKQLYLPRTCRTNLNNAAGVFVALQSTVRLKTVLTRVRSKDEMTRASVAIASIGRETLLDTLRSVAAVRLPEEMVLDVLIADDSSDGDATKLVAAHPIKNLQVTCLTVASGNISTARNALIDAAEGDWLIFVDDDEWVEPNWLEKLFLCQKEFEADVVIGPVHPVYPDGTPAWLQEANPLYSDWGSRGKRLYTGRGGNTLVRVDLIRSLQLRFDEAYGRTGGEDTIFFGQAAERGARIFATDDAIAREHVPSDRLSVNYILSRAVRSGQSYGQMRLTRHPDPVWHIFFALAALTKCAAAGLLAVGLRIFNRPRSFRMRQKLALNTGKLRAVLSLPLAELYKKTE